MTNTKHHDSFHSDNLKTVFWTWGKKCISKKSIDNKRYHSFIIHPYNSANCQ